MVETATFELLQGLGATVSIQRDTDEGSMRFVLEVLQEATVLLRKTAVFVHCFRNAADVNLRLLARRTVSHGEPSVP